MRPGQIQLAEIKLPTGSKADPRLLAAKAFLQSFRLGCVSEAKILSFRMRIKMSI